MSFNRFFNAGKPWTILVPLGLLIVGCVSAHLYINHRAIAKVAEAARQAYYNRKFDAADREIRRWIELLPNSGEPWYWKARIELAREHPQETLNALQNAHDRGYAEKELEVITAIMEVFSGKYDQHEPTLKQAFEQTTTPAPELDQALSRLYLASYQFASATKTLQRWMKDAPDDPRPYLWLNKIDERTSTDVAPIVKNYREALKRDPSLAEARLGLADTLRTGRRAAEAAKEYEDYLKLNPKSVDGLRGAGQVALVLGDSEAATKYFNEVLSQNAKDAVALRELAMIDIRSGNSARASQRLQAAVEVEPFDPDLHFNLAKALKLAGKTKESEEAVAQSERLRKEQEVMNDLREQLVANPADTKLRLKAAQWLLAHGHDKEGLEWTDLILKSNPGDRDTCLFLADYYKSKGNNARANYYRIAAAPTQ